jgi:hypothetical protein
VNKRPETNVDVARIRRSRNRVVALLLFAFVILVFYSTAM